MSFYGQCNLGTASRELRLDWQLVRGNTPICFWISRFMTTLPMIDTSSFFWGKIACRNRSTAGDGHQDATASHCYMSLLLLGIQANF
jgi:hypothetical protein